MFENRNMDKLIYRYAYFISHFLNKVNKAKYCNFLSSTLPGVLVHGHLHINRTLGQLTQNKH